MFSLPLCVCARPSLCVRSRACEGNPRVPPTGQDTPGGQKRPRQSVGGRVRWQSCKVEANLSSPLHPHTHPSRPLPVHDTGLRACVMRSSIELRRPLQDLLTPSPPLTSPRWRANNTHAPRRTFIIFFINFIFLNCRRLSCFRAGLLTHSSSPAGNTCK